MLRNALTQSAIGDRCVGIVWLNTLKRMDRKFEENVANVLMFCWSSPVVNRYRRSSSASSRFCCSKSLFFWTKLVRAWQTTGRRVTCWYRTLANSSANGWLKAWDQWRTSASKPFPNLSVNHSNSATRPKFVPPRSLESWLPLSWLSLFLHQWLFDTVVRSMEQSIQRSDSTLYFWHAISESAITNRDLDFHGCCELNDRGKIPLVLKI